MSTYENYMFKGSKTLNKNQLPNGGINSTIITKAAVATDNANAVAFAGEMILNNNNTSNSQIAVLGQSAQESANAAKSIAIDAKQASIDLKTDNPKLSKEMKVIAKNSAKASKNAQTISNMCQFKITNSQSYIKINKFQQPRSDFDQKMQAKWA